MKKDKTLLPERMKIARGAVSQSDVSRNLDIPQNTYSRYETGASEPPLALLFKIAHLFGVTTDWLLGLTDNRSGGAMLTAPRADPLAVRDAEIARLLDIIESQQRTIEALARGGSAPAAPAGSSGSSRGSARALDA